MTTVPLFPLGQALFPSARMALQVFEPRYLKMVRNCQKNNEVFGIVLIRQGAEVVRPGADPMPRLAQLGTFARIVDCRPRLQGRLAVVVEGEEKFRLLATSQQDDHLVLGDVEALPAEPAVQLEAGEGLAALLSQLLRHPPIALLRIIPALGDTGRLANQLAQLLPLAPEDQFAVLAEMDPAARVALLAGLARQTGLTD